MLAWVPTHILLVFSVLTCIGIVYMGYLIYQGNKEYDSA
jgi:hypothetical protein